MKKKPDTITLDLNGKPMMVSRPNPDRLVSLPATVPLLDFKLIKNKKLTAKVRFSDKSEQTAEFHPNESITHYDANAQLVQFIKKEPMKGNGQSNEEQSNVHTVDERRNSESMELIKAALTKDGDGTYFHPRIQQDFIKPGVKMTSVELRSKGGAKVPEVIQWDGALSPVERQEAFFKSPVNSYQSSFMEGIRKSVSQ